MSTEGLYLWQWASPWDPYHHMLVAARDHREAIRTARRVMTDACQAIDMDTLLDIRAQLVRLDDGTPAAIEGATPREVVDEDVMRALGWWVPPKRPSVEVEDAPF